ncbi:RNA polymerase II-associated protein 3, partial [Pseudocercospora fuligena]
MDSNQIVEHFKHQQELQKELHKNASARKGQRPRRKATRLELEGLFPSSQQLPNDAVTVQTTVIGTAYPPCTASLHFLKPMRIEDLRLETHHRGCVLFLRTFGTPLRMQAVHNVVEDCKGDVERLAAYNFEVSLSPEQVLPKHGIFAVKEPYYKLTADGGTTIRVDHPSDLVKIRSYDANVPAPLRTSVQDHRALTASALKDIGNVAFKQRKPQDALDHYTHALDICNDGELLLRADLHRNRALVNLYLQRYEAARADCNAAILDSSSEAAHLVAVNLKARYRGGRAAYGAMDFEGAKAEFQSVLAISPSDADAIRELQRTKQRISESSRGLNDFETMSTSNKKGIFRLDHASFTANVEVRQTQTQGRGLFAKKHIAAGELVLCEKAYAVAFGGEENDKLSVILNVNNDNIDYGTHATRLNRVVSKLLYSYQDARQFFDLYDGGYESREVTAVQDGLVAVDTFRALAILSYNGFGIGEDQKLSGGSTGVWICASYVNHDCICNANRAFIGDMMIVRAIRDIAKDEEITMQYQSPDDGIEAFQNQLKKSWGFRCTCELCNAEANVEASKQKLRNGATRKARAFLEDPTNVLDDEHIPGLGRTKQAEKLYKILESTYEEKLFANLPRPALHNLALWLCMAYAIEAPEKVLSMTLQLLRDLGIMVTISKSPIQKVVIDRSRARFEWAAVHAAMYAGAVLEQQGQALAAKGMKMFGKEVYRTLKGSMDGFEEIF